MGWFQSQRRNRFCTIHSNKHKEAYSFQRANLLVDLIILIKDFFAYDNESIFIKHLGKVSQMPK